MSHSRRASECDGPSSPDSLVLGLNYTDGAAISAAVLLIIDEFGYSNAPFGLILSAFFWEYTPFNFLEGYTSKKFRPPWVMGLAVAWWSAFTAVTLMPLSATGVVEFVHFIDNLVGLVTPSVTGFTGDQTAG